LRLHVAEFSCCDAFRSVRAVPPRPLTALTAPGRPPPRTRLPERFPREASAAPAASPASAAPAAIAGVPDFRAARVVLCAPCLTASAGRAAEPFADALALEPLDERRCCVRAIVTPTGSWSSSVEASRDGPRAR